VEEIFICNLHIAICAFGGSMTQEIFDRSRRLVGDEVMEKLAAAKVAVCGLGGVGSFAAEALVRSGVGQITLIDFDTVTASNINRQLPALQSTIGLAKADVLAERFRDINPHCHITIHKQFITEDNVDVLLNDVDYVLDAIDSLPGKVAIIKYCRDNGLAIISAMGAGMRLDPAQLRVADISETKNCPLARSLRKRLRKIGIENGVTVAYSEERPPAAYIAENENIRTPASCIFVPGSMGLLMASYIVRQIIVGAIHESPAGAS
jgi:tRNA A37 threonylcarbamoyladenosine dehydratase